MVTEQTLSRVVKALVSEVGPDSRTKKWLVDFAGLSPVEVNAVLRWLKLRKHVKVYKSGKVVLEKHARTIVLVMVQSRMAGMLVQLDDPPMDGVADDPIARRIFNHYHECLLVRSSWVGRGKRRSLPSWAQQPAAMRATFVKAAKSAREMEAPVMEYVQAQFVALDRVGQWKQVQILPTPNSLVGTSAQQRYVQFQAEMEERIARQAPKKRRKSDFSHEERVLNALCKFNDTGPATILRCMPTQFSREFLKQKGVWKEVKTVWLAAGDSV